MNSNQSTWLITLNPKNITHQIHTNNLIINMYMFHHINMSIPCRLLGNQYQDLSNMSCSHISNLSCSIGFFTHIPSPTDWNALLRAAFPC